MTRYPPLELPVLVLGVLVVAWGFVLLRLTHRSSHGRSVALAFLCFATSATTVVRPLRYALDRASGLPDLSIMIGNLAALAGIAFMLRFGLAAMGTNAAVVRAGRYVLTGAAVVMAAMFAIVPRSLAQPDFGYWQPTHPATVTYHLVANSCMAAGTLAGAVLLVPLWRGKAHGSLRTALLLLWLGCLSLLGYTACRYWYVLWYGFGVVPPQTRYETYGRFTELALYLGLLLVVLSGLVQAGARALRWARRLDGYRRLGPLWTELTGAVPSVVLGDPPRWFARSLELRLYRRAVEIRDAQLELAGRVSPDTRAFAGMNLEDAGVTAPLALDACVLRIGLASPEALHPAETSAWSAASSLDEELADLLALQRELRDQAVVAAARRSLTPR